MLRKFKTGRSIIGGVVLWLFWFAPFVPAFPDDDWGTNFFDVDGTVDPSERPSSLHLDLPESLDEISPIDESDFPELAGWIRWLTLKNLPESYEDNRKWGKQKAVFERIDFDIDKFKLSANKKYKYVKHGTWSRYFIELVEPKERLTVNVMNLGQPSPSALSFDVVVEADLKAFGRISQWQRDIQLYSISANADGRARLSANCEVQFVLIPLKFPPDIEVRPKLTRAHIELLEFKVRRISQVGGSVAHEMGKFLKKAVDEKLNEYDSKLVEKANNQIERQKERLRLSSQSWLSSTLSGVITPQQEGRGP